MSDLKIMVLDNGPIPSDAPSTDTITMRIQYDGVVSTVELSPKQAISLGVDLIHVASKHVDVVPQ
jgi:hypothetical protein